MTEFKLIETLLYKNETSEVEGEFLISDDTLWANRKVVAEIFGTSPNNISIHFKNIIQDGELEEKEVSISSKELFNGDFGFSKDFLQNSKKGGRPQIWYNLDAIISIGYRINSKEATQFRKWSNKILKEYMIKGYVLDKDLLKKGGRFTKDYFDELLEEIREIRISGRRFNQKITDIYATSFDYDPNTKTSKDFFANAQNKLIYAISENTAAEIIMARSDKDKLNMGLYTWNKGPEGKILATDVVISKNYLDEIELKKLQRLVDGFLTLAENRASNHKPTSMNDWMRILDNYILLNDLPLFERKGKVSSSEAKEKARMEFSEFRKYQDKNYVSDFDKVVDEVKRLNGG